MSPVACAGSRLKADLRRIKTFVSVLSFSDGGKIRSLPNMGQGGSGNFGLSFLSQNAGKIKIDLEARINTTIQCKVQSPRIDFLSSYKPLCNQCLSATQGTDCSSCLLPRLNHFANRNWLSDGHHEQDRYSGKNGHRNSRKTHIFI